MNRTLLKRRALDTIRTSKPSAVAVGGVYIIITSILSFYLSTILSSNMTTEGVSKFYSYIASNRPDYALMIWESMQPPKAFYYLQFGIKLLSQVLACGFILYLLNTIRGTEPCFGNLLDGFGFFFKIIFLKLLSSLLIFLWSLLLVVPGIMAAYRYSMAFYILCDDPSKSVFRCLKESSQIMNGHKRELFTLDLSFLGWIILQTMPLFGYVIRLWAVPYIGMTKAVFYNDLLSKPEAADSIIYA